MTEFTHNSEKQKLYESVSQSIQLEFYRELENIFIQKAREIGQLEMLRTAKLKKLYEDIRDEKG